MYAPAAWGRRALWIGVRSVAMLSTVYAKPEWEIRLHGLEMLKSKQKLKFLVFADVFYQLLVQDR
jgi:hypothetical protein